MTNFIAISSGHARLLAVSVRYGVATELDLEQTLCPYTQSPDQLRVAFNLVSDRLKIDSRARPRVVVSVPGLSNDWAANTLTSAIGKSKLPLSGKSKQLFLTDDTNSLLLAASPTAHGVSILCGAGSSVFVGDGAAHGICRRPQKLDGHGPLIGDRGSGFDLAFSLITRLNEMYDEGVHPPRDLVECLGIGLPDSIVADRSPLSLSTLFSKLRDEFGNSWHLRIADLAPYILSIAENDGEDEQSKKLANELVTTAAERLAHTVHWAIQRNSDAQSASVYGHGFMLRSSKLFRNQVNSRLPKHHQPLRLSRYHPLVGCMRLACSDSWPPEGTWVQPEWKAHMAPVLEQFSSEFRSRCEYQVSGET